MPTGNGIYGCILGLLALRFRGGRRLLTLHGWYEPVIKIICQSLFHADRLWVVAGAGNVDVKAERRRKAIVSCSNDFRFLG